MVSIFLDYLDELIYLGLSFCFGSKNFGSEKIVEAKKYLGAKNFGPKKSFSSKISLGP